MALRKAGKDIPPTEHRCSYSVMQHGTGHTELDHILEEASPLCFEFELLRVDQPGNYQQDHWAMTDDEKATAIPVLKEEGNSLYKEGKHNLASEKYFQALSYLEEQIIKEKPKSETWHAITKQKVPLLLNYAQCKLLMQDYADAIRQTTSVLEVEPKNIKALYRRGKAHSASWDVEEATRDLRKAAELDNSLTHAVEKELRALGERVKEKDVAERDRLRGKMFT